MIYHNGIQSIQRIQQFHCQAKEKERRLKQREEKMEEQRHHQEERIKRALERAKAEPRKRVC